MPKAIQVYIPEPCHENWQQMIPNEQGRHCLSCQKTVVDFSMMSDKEILNYISSASSQVCGRFANDQLNKDLVMGKKRKFSFVYFWNLLIATFLITGKAYSQGDTVIKKEVVMEQEPEVTLGTVALPEELIVPSFEGMVLDINNRNPVPGASITVPGAKKGVIADADGNFHLKWPKRSKPAVIEISAVGYKTQTINVNSQSNWKNIEVLMEPEIFALDTAFVTGYEPKVCTEILGGIGYSIQETVWEKTRKQLAEYLPGIKEVQVFPNPVIKGNFINLKLNLKETGEYKMELMDMGGRVVMVRSVLVNIKNQPASLPTNITWSAGIYWVRLTGRHTKKTYQSKILIQ